MSPERISRGRRPLAILVVAAAVVTIVIVSAHRSSARSSLPSRASSMRPPSVAPGGRPVDPQRFAAGSCVVFAPTSGNRHLTVFLDAGHGGIDPGAIGTTSAGTEVKEADLTLPVELDAMAQLRQQGFTVVVSRTSATTVARLTPAEVSGGIMTVQGSHDDVAGRAECANEAHAQLLVGIYFNAGSSSANAGSVTGYDAVRPFSAANLRFANLLQSDVLNAMNARGWDIPDGGIYTDNYLGSALNEAAVAYGHLLLLGPAESGYFDTPSQMPGALIEPLFVTDPYEASVANSAPGQQVIATGIANAVEQYFAAS